MIASRAVGLLERISVYVHADDPISRAGVASQLRGHSGLRMVEQPDSCDDGVALVVAEEMDEQAARAIRSLRRRGAQRVVLVVSRVDGASLLAAVEAGASGLVRRGQVTPETLIGAIRSAAAGDGTVPPDLLGSLLEQVGRLQRNVLSPRGLTISGLTEREVRVLKLLAEGLDTAEVARELYYSDRTVKNILHDVTSRLNLRNRTHAVAYAIRQGLI
jgi:DNA-binding NarL/FixJ family response regulator